MPEIGRRRALAFVSALPFVTASKDGLAFGAPAPDDETLAQAARLGGLGFGSAVRLEQLTADLDYRALLLAQCSQFTPEIALKWAVVEPRQGELDFSRIDPIAAIARANGKSMRGHTLIWDKSVPDWARALLARSPDWEIVKRYFASVVPRFGETVKAWDVVNEPIETGHRMDGLRDGIFLRAFGPGYIARAFHEARVYAPAAKLYLNEFDLEYDTPDQAARRYLLLKLLEDLKTSGAPVDGLGLQSHLDLAKGSVSKTALEPFLRAVQALGLELAVTELDVKESDFVASAATRDAQVADEVRRYLDIVLPQPGLRSVSTWGLSDRSSWLEVTREDRARFPGAWRDGTTPGLNRGLPFDSDLRPKPFFDVLRQAMAQRRPTGRTAA